MEIDRCLDVLCLLYGSRAKALLAEIRLLIDEYRLKDALPRVVFDQRDVFMIAYGDSIIPSEGRPIAALTDFISRRLSGVFNSLHILPFYPYSSDDGFSVTDYLKVRDDLGTWADVHEAARHVRVMADLVLNHISARSGWLSEYLAGGSGFGGLAIEYQQDFDYSRVIRPRTTPLFTEVHGRRLWTTFGPDQVDLDYSEPATLLRMLRVLGAYLNHGVGAVRLDAVGFLWKESGSTCMNLPGAHHVVSIIRAFMEDCAGGAVLVTETNVPHAENVSYFGKGSPEAHVVYNFALPPLILHAYFSHDASLLRDWAKKELFGEKDRAFLNFTASHDGIGLRPLEGIVAAPEIEGIISRVVSAGGAVSYRDMGGKKAPYEINATFVDAVTSVSGADRADMRPFLGSQALAMWLPGIPAVYINSLFGLRNWEKGVAETRRLRTINRYKMTLEEAESMADGDYTPLAGVYDEYKRLLDLRVSNPVFSPDAKADYPYMAEGVFAVLRSKGRDSALCLVNLTAEAVPLSALDTRGHGRAILGDGVTLEPFGAEILVP